MNLFNTIQKLAVVMDRANEFIDANAAHMLPDNKTKMIDMATISLMQYEDHVFHWDQLKNIVSDLVDKRINGSPLWFIDISRSTSAMIVIASTRSDKHIALPVETFMMTTQLYAH